MRRFWSVTNVSLAHAIKIFPKAGITLSSCRNGRHKTAPAHSVLVADRQRTGEPLHDRALIMHSIALPRDTGPAAAATLMPLHAAPEGRAQGSQARVQMLLYIV